MLRRRHELECWINSDTLIRNFLEQMEEDFFELFFADFMRIVTTQNDVKAYPVEGSVGEQIYLKDVLGDQLSQIDFMQTLREKQQASAARTDEELRALEAETSKLELRAEDIRALRNEEQFQNVDEYKMNRKDILIERLQESLTSPSMTIDDVVNMLRNDLYEKAKQRELAKIKSKMSGKYFNQRHLAIIVEEFTKPTGKRDIKILDDVCQSLRFFSRF